MAWAERKLQTVAARQNLTRLENEKESREHSQITFESPSRWDELGKILKDETAIYNKGCTQHLSVMDVGTIEPDTSCKMIHSGDAEMTLTFNRRVPQIAYSVKKVDGPSSPTVVKTSGSISFEAYKGRVWFVHDNAQDINVGRHNVPEMAAILLDLVVE